MLQSSERRKRRQASRRPRGGEEARREHGVSSPGTLERARSSGGAPSKLQPLILVVDDFADAREMLRDLLEFAGFQIAEADRGDVAVAMATQLRPAVILMDLAMPGMGGLEAIRLLKLRAETCALPIIALTAHALPENEKAAFDAGCSAFLTKPVHPTELLREVRRILES